MARVGERLQSVDAVDVSAEDLGRARERLALAPWHDRVRWVQPTGNDRLPFAEGECVAIAGMGMIQ